VAAAEGWRYAVNELTDMKIRAIAPWFGSKRTLAPRIVEELGPHSAYWEPFCGSAAVLLAKPVASSETVNDLHGELINLARVLRDEQHALALYSALSRTMMHESLLTEAAEIQKARGRIPAPDQPDLQRAIEFMVCSWFGRNGVAGTESYNQGFCVRYTKNGGDSATRWRSCIDSIPAWHRRLCGVTILNRDAFKLLSKIDDASGVCIYVDPPYLKKGANYIHDFESDDHDQLAEFLSRFKKTRVVVSYYDHPRLAELYPGWTKRKMDVNKALANQMRPDLRQDGGGAVKAPEVLLINGLSLVADDTETEASLFAEK
jgi:DNA adenine methylase